mmetsp:Transcript_30934/g.84513  ORF Transcript_30934/g.84513 Transcript_30934/m.84513 type:complete len:366 (+) Transcript_30934:579-1676(+)
MGRRHASIREQKHWHHRDEHQDGVGNHPRQPFGDLANALRRLVLEARAFNVVGAEGSECHRRAHHGEGGDGEHEQGDPRVGRRLWTAHDAAEEAEAVHDTERADVLGAFSPERQCVACETVPELSEEARQRAGAHLPPAHVCVDQLPRHVHLSHSRDARDELPQLEPYVTADGGLGHLAPGNKLYLRAFAAAARGKLGLPVGLDALVPVRRELLCLDGRLGGARRQAKGHLNVEVCRVLARLRREAVGRKVAQRILLAASIDELAAAKHHHLVESIDHREARLVQRGDDEDAVPLAKVLQHINNKARVDRVERAGGLVEQQDRRASNELRANAYAAQLAARELFLRVLVVTREVRARGEAEEGEN